MPGTEGERFAELKAEAQRRTADPT
jgi:hypothetical protein